MERDLTWKVLLCCQFFFELVYLLRVGFQTCKEWKLFLVRQVLVLLCFWFLCVAPLRVEGLRGKKTTPSIGWEVAMKSLDWKVEERSSSARLIIGVRLQLSNIFVSILSNSIVFVMYIRILFIYCAMVLI
jgi:hypothetical protein